MFAVHLTNWPRVELKALLLLAVMVVGLMCVSVQGILAMKLYVRTL